MNLIIIILTVYVIASIVFFFVTLKSVWLKRWRPVSERPIESKALMVKSVVGRHTFIHLAIYKNGFYYQLDGYFDSEIAGVSQWKYLKDA